MVFSARGRSAIAVLGAFGLAATLVAIGDAVAPAVAGASPSVTVYDFPFEGSDRTYPGQPKAINSSGTVVGSYSTSNGSVPLVWNPAGGGLNRLPLPSGYGTANAFDINDNGVIVGYGYNPSTGGGAIAWVNGSPTALASVESDGGSQAVAVNNAGVIAGHEHIGTEEHAVKWSSSGVVEDIDKWGFVSLAYGINDSGAIVGYHWSFGGPRIAFLMAADESTVDLPALGSGAEYGAEAFAINTAGAAVGYVTSADGVTHAARWDAGTHALHVLDSSSSQALAINDSGQVVGWSAATGSARLATWDASGSRTELSSLPAYGPLAINNSGDIVGIIGTMASNPPWKSFLATSDQSRFPGLTSSKTVGNDSSHTGKNGDPVNMATGNFDHTKVDLTYPASVYGMDLSRTYNSIDTHSSSLGLDPGWTTSLDVALLPDALGAGGLTYVGPTGSRSPLVSAGANAWVAPDGLSATVTKLADSTFAIQHTSGERWEFDTYGRLTRKCEGIADWATRAAGWCGAVGNGQYVTIAWPADPAGRPTGVTSSNGMSQAFSYDGNNQLGSVVAHDDANVANDRTVTLSYTNQRLAWVSAPHLATETAGVPVETYGRDVAGHVNAIAATLSLADGSPDPAGSIPIIGNVYSDSGVVLQQTNPTGDVATYTWDWPNRQVTVTSSTTPDVIRYSHDANARLVTVADITDSAHPKAVTKTWDAATAPTQATELTDRAGAVFGYTYDSAGRISQKAIPDPATGTLPARTAGPGSPFPTPAAGAAWGLETYTYLGANDSRIATFTNAEGAVTKYEYPTASRIPNKTTKGFGSASPLVNLTETSNNRTDATQDGDGVTTCNFYDAAGRTTETFTLLVATNTAQTLTQNCAAHRNDWNALATQNNIARTSYTYTALGQVKTETPPELQGTAGPIASTTYTYFGWGPQKSVTDALGKSQTFTYTALGETATNTDELGKTTTRTHVVNQAAAVCGSAGAGCSIITTTGPMHNQFINGVSGAKVDQATEMVYDSAGDLREQRTPAASLGAAKPKTVFVHGAFGTVKSETDPLGRVTQRAFDANNMLVGTTSGTNAADVDATESLTLDKLGRVVTRVSPKNDAGRVTTQIKYDRLGHEIEKTVATGMAEETKTTTSYLPNGLTDTTSLVRSDAPHVAATPATVARTYTPGGRVRCVDTRLQEARSGQVESHLYEGTFYDDAGRERLTTTPVAAVTSCLDHVAASTNGGRTYYQPDTAYWAVKASSYRRDGKLAGQQLPTQYALHHPVSPWLAPDNDGKFQTSYAYDNKGRRTATKVPSPVDPNVQAVSTTCYTARDEVAMTIDATNGVTASTYFDSVGVVKQTVDPTGMVVNAGTPCASAPVAGGKRGQTDYTVDGSGNVLTRKVYNDALTAQLTETWTYNGKNLPLTYTDQLTRKTTWAYAISAGVLSTRTTTTGDKADVTGPSLRKQVENFYKSGKPKDVTSTQYAADGTTVVTTSTVRSTYDNAGRRKTVIENPGASQKVTTITYNAANQITKMTLPDTKVVQAQWDLDGHQTLIVYPDTSQRRFSYDAGVRLATADALAFGAWANLATYTYNANGQMTNEVAGGNTRAWTVNGQSGAMTLFNQFVSSTTSKWDVTYDAAGRVKTDCSYSGASCGTSPKTTYGYDAAGQLLTATVANAAAGQVNARTYTYGNRANRLTQAVGTQGGSTATTTYVWDNAAQLTGTTGADVATYAYDAAGRRTSITRAAGLSTTTAYDERAKPKTITTTGSGNPITEVRTYDAFGQLTGQTLAQTGSTSHATTYWWDNTGRQAVPQLFSATVDATVHRYNYGVERVTDTGTSYAYDYQGSTIASTGVAAPAAYDPFGVPVPAFGGSGSYANYDGFGYHGELTLGSLTDLRARDYDAATGTFTTKDPLPSVRGTTSVANPYTYTYNSPLNATDPTGNRSKPGSFPSNTDDLKRKAQDIGKRAPHTKTETAGGCIDAGVIVNVFGDGFNGCLLFDIKGFWTMIGFYVTAGPANGGGAVGDALFATAGPIYSNAPTADGLNGPDFCVDVAAGFGAGANVGVCISLDAPKRGEFPVYTIYAGIGFVTGYGAVGSFSYASVNFLKRYDEVPYSICHGIFNAPGCR